LLQSVVLTPEHHLAMAELRTMVEQLGYQNVRTLASTGNLVFEAANTTLPEIEDKLELAFEETFGKHVDFIVRCDCDWLALASLNPFPDGDGGAVAVRLMRNPPTPATLDALKAKAAQNQRIAVIGCDLWIDFADKASETKLLSALATKRMGVGTLRNWNTVRGLVDMIV
jgi:uncharacterized protein (DUF1697 family)